MESVLNHGVSSCEYPPDIQPVVQNQNIGLFSVGQAAGHAIDSGAFRGCEAGHAKDGRQICGRRVFHPANHVIHSHDGAGEAAGSGPADLTVARKRGACVSISEDIITGWHIESAIAVGHEAQSFGTFHAESEFEQFRGQMVSVSNDFRAHVRIHQDEFGHAALHRGAKTLTKRRYGAHCTPEMIDMAHACIEGCLHFVPAGIGMTAGDQAAMSASKAIEICGPGKFRSARGDLNHFRGEVGGEVIGVRSSALRPVMTTGFVFGEVRAVEVDARDGCAQFRTSDDFCSCQSTRSDHLQKGLVASCGGRGEEGGCAVIQMRSAHGQNIFYGSIHKIGTSTTVNMDINKSRSDVPPLGIDHKCAWRERFSLGDLSDLTSHPDNHSVFDQCVRKNDGTVDNGRACETGWHGA